MKTKDDRIRVYRKAAYVAFSDEVGEIAIQVGRPAPQLDKLLRSKGLKTAALVTAYNPRGQVLSAKENSLRQRELVRTMRALRYAWIEAEGRDAAGLWMPERSVLIFGIDRFTAIRFGQEFGQPAIVFCTLGKPCTLVRSPGPSARDKTGSPTRPLLW